MKVTRAQIRKGVQGVDVTARVQGRARAFAPTWDMVHAFKAGTLTPGAFIKQYKEILRAVTPEDWVWLRDQHVGGVLTLLCYCREGWFCHTHILIDYMLTHFPGIEDGRAKSPRVNLFKK